MIKTLRITSIIAAVLAAVFFVLPAVFGVRGDEQIERFLNSAGVIEKFKEAWGDKVRDSQHEISPLVKQAEAFALYLNPPPQPKTESPAAGKQNSKPRPKAAVSPKFQLIGTSCYTLHPELSLALIDEPGKGLHWVRQSSKVGHLIIEQVKDGLIVVRDGTRTFELVAERPERRSLLKADSSSGGRITDSRPPAIDAEVQMSAEEKAALVREAEAIQVDVEPGETDSNPKVEGIAAARKRPVSNLETMRISAREAKRLGRLGQRLKNVQRGPNRVENDGTERDANLVEPNAGDLNLNEPSLNDTNIPG